MPRSLSMPVITSPLYPCPSIVVHQISVANVAIVRRVSMLSQESKARILAVYIVAGNVIETFGRIVIYLCGCGVCCMGDYVKQIHKAAITIDLETKSHPARLLVTLAISEPSEGQVLVLDIGELKLDFHVLQRFQIRLFGHELLQLGYGKPYFWVWIRTCMGTFLKH